MSLKINSLAAFYELPSKQLAKSVNIDIDDTDAQKTDKLLANYFQYQKVGLRLWIKQMPLHRNQASWQNSLTWFPRGETILQNKGLQIRINLLPYLGSQYVDLNGAIGFQIVDKGNGRLSGADYISVSGEYEFELTALPKVIGVVNLVETLTQNAD